MNFKLAITRVMTSFVFPMGLLIYFSFYSRPVGDEIFMIAFIGIFIGILILNYIITEYVFELKYKHEDLIDIPTYVKVLLVIGGTMLPFIGFLLYISIGTDARARKNVSIGKYAGIGVFIIAITVPILMLWVRYR